MCCIFHHSMNNFHQIETSWIFIYNVYLIDWCLTSPTAQLGHIGDWQYTEFWIFAAWHGVTPYSSRNVYHTGSFTCTNIHKTTVRSERNISYFARGGDRTRVYGMYDMWVDQQTNWATQAPKYTMYRCSCKEQNSPRISQAQTL